MVGPNINFDNLYFRVEIFPNLNAFMNKIQITAPILSRQDDYQHWAGTNWLIRQARLCHIKSQIRCIMEYILHGPTSTYEHYALTDLWNGLNLFSPQYILMYIYHHLTTIYSIHIHSHLNIFCESMELTLMYTHSLISGEKNICHFLYWTSLISFFIDSITQIMTILFHSPLQCKLHQSFPRAPKPPNPYKGPLQGPSTGFILLHLER